MPTSRTENSRASDPLRESQLRISEDVVLLGGSAIIALGLVLQALSPDQTPVTRIAAVTHLVLAAAVIGARRSGQQRLRACLVVVYALGFGAAAMSKVGPLVGVGATLMAASVLAARFFGVRGAVVASIATCLLVGIGGHGYVRGWIPSPALASAWIDGAGDWMRIAGATSVAMLLMGVLVAQVGSRLERAYARAIRTLDVEREDRKDRLRGQEILAGAGDVDALGTHAGSVAHDVNNSLAIILVNAEMLSEAHGSPCENKDLADEMIVAGRRAAETTKSLLRLGTHKTQAAKTTDPGPVCERLAALLRRTLPDSVEVILEVSGGCSAPIDGADLEQILLARALDARDASGSASAGRIIIRVKDHRDARGRRGTRIEVHCAPSSTARDSISASRSRDVTSRVGATTSERVLSRVGGSIVFEQLGAEVRVRVDLPGLDKGATQDRRDPREVRALRRSTGGTR